MHVLDLERMKYINSPEYSSDGTCPRCCEKYKTRKATERMSVHGDIIENYLPILAEDSNLLSPAGRSYFPSCTWSGKFEVNVKTHRNDGIINAYFNTLLSLNDEDYVYFISAARKSVEAGKIICKDGVFLTDCNETDCQKKLNHYE